MPGPTGEVSRALPLDGTRLDRDLVALTACDGRRVASRHMAESEASGARGAPFTHPDPALTAEGPLPRANDPIEVGVDTRPRDVLRNHRGPSPMRRAKAAFRWCHTHAEGP